VSNGSRCGPFRCGPPRGKSRRPSLPVTGNRFHDEIVRILLILAHADDGFQVTQRLTPGSGRNLCLPERRLVLAGESQASTCRPEHNRLFTFRNQEVHNLAPVPLEAYSSFF
jgi:hypothetical protein